MSRPPKGKTSAPAKETEASPKYKTQGNFTPAGGALQAPGADPFAKSRVIWNAWIEPPSRKLVLLALADYADADGTNIRPALATIAARCSMSDKQARRHLHDLIGMSLLRMTRASAQHRPAAYALNLEAIAALPLVGVLTTSSTPMGVRQHSHGCPSDLPPTGVNQCKTRGRPPTRGAAPLPGPASPARVGSIRRYGLTGWPLAKKTRPRPRCASSRPGVRKCARRAMT